MAGCTGNCPLCPHGRLVYDNTKLGNTKWLCALIYKDKFKNERRTD